MVKFDDGTNGGMLSNPLDEAVVQRDKDILAMVRDAVAYQRIMLAYQPIVSARDTRRVAFHEGLMRVMDRSGRIIPASEFIDAVEAHEIGRQLDCLALEMGLAALSRVPELRLSINLSARSIGYDPWRNILRRGLASAPDIGERLILEITESSAMIMPDTVCIFMKEFQQRGVSFALDDFGAGQTAFRYLRDFYFDIIKIDGQFINGIATSSDNQVLTAALISIAQHFEMFSVAECVEDKADAQMLIDLGIDCLQGHYFGVPTVRPSWLLDETSRLVS